MMPSGPPLLCWDFDDFKENIVKWLSVPVDDYFRNGLQDEDYCAGPYTFIKTWQTDIDVDQQFHNIQSHESNRPYLGVRMIDTCNDGSQEKHWFLRFKCLRFGGRASAYIANQAQARIMEFALKDRCSQLSAFQWDRVRLNLPTMMGWDP
jgi:hypothetical protein